MFSLPWGVNRRTCYILCAVECEQQNVLYSLCRRVGTVERVVFSVP